MKRKYSHGESSLTLQSLIDNTTSDQSLPKASRRSRASQLRTVARVIGKPPVAIAATVVNLRSALALANPGPAGLSRDYWGMCRSSVWWAMEKAGVTVIRATGIELPADLASAVELLPWRPHRLTLSPLLTFMTKENLLLPQFDQHAADRFRDWMKAGYRKRAWQRPYRRAVEMFIQCGLDFPAVWPRAELKVRFDDDHYTLGWDVFPELETEVDKMFAAMAAQPRRRSQISGMRPLRNTTISLRKYYILRAASAIVIKSGAPPSSICSLRQVINPEGIEMFVDFVVERRNGADRTGDLSQACGAFNVIARHWLKLEKAQIDELVNIRRTLLPRQGPAERNKLLMEDFRSASMRLAFLRMPHRVLDRLKRKADLTDRDREHGELAFITAFLTCAPLRISEFLALVRGEHILDRGLGKHRNVVVTIPGDLRKVDEQITFRLSPRIIRSMDLFWERFRRGADTEASAHLFPGFKRPTRCSHNVSQQLAKFTTRELGRRITAQQFRVLVGYIFLKRNPGCYEAVRRFLGHKSIRTTMIYYAFMLEDEAFEELDKTVDELLGDG